MFKMKISLASVFCQCWQLSSLCSGGYFLTVNHGRVFQRYEQIQLSEDSAGIKLFTADIYNNLIIF